MPHREPDVFLLLLFLLEQVDGTCACQTGFGGLACDVELCPISDCSGHGSCQNATCICDSGYMGIGCENVMAVHANFSCPGNCSSHGVCIDNACHCDYKWTGLDCSTEEICPNDCSNRGSCNNGTCVCDFGYVGVDCGKFSAETIVGSSLCAGNCSGHGSCAADNSTCLCDAGYHGADCSSVGLQDSAAVVSCPGNCTGHGTCINGTTCACDAGWTADDCSVAVAWRAMGSSCLNNCSGHGSCTANGTCVCDASFLGADCSLSVIGAEPCAMNCSGHGACYNSTCWCDHGFIGAFCEMMGPGATPVPRMGPGATPVPWLGSTPAYSMSCTAGGCSGRGACNTDTGLCICDPGYIGTECETYLIAECINDCSQHGACLNGTCVCDLNWGGDDCSLLSTCGGHTQLTVNCSGHGACQNGTCACDDGWGGADCSSINCMNDCSGRGICANGTCACDFGWRGGDCSAVSCPNDCSGHGTCTSHHAVPTCICDDLFTGSDCGMQLCPTTLKDPYVPCSGNGACTQNGTCTCYNNYDGDACDDLIDCSGRGVRKCGFCSCEDGFVGDECEIDVCEDSRIYDPSHPKDHRLAEVCSGKGVCTTARGCVCNSGAGRNCSLVATCPDDCNGHGMCKGQNGLQNDPGTCMCDRHIIVDSPFTTPKYSGVACEKPLCPGVRQMGTATATCSGKGVCNGNARCDCFDVTGEGVYTGEDCGVPPQFFVSDIEPKVGPLEGGTLIVITGPGLERLLAAQQRSGKDMHCDFQSGQTTPVEVGTTFDTVKCVSPPVATSRIISLKFVDNAGTALIAPDRMTAQFEYFVQTTVIRVWPSFAPLRPDGDNGQNTPDLKRPNTVTVTGDYFPPHGKYVCRFGDCDALPGKTKRIDKANLECEMPPLQNPDVYPLTVTSNAQQYSTQSGSNSLFTVYGITGISPSCASEQGTAVLTVFGKYLVDEDDLSRNEERFYCRFGTVTNVGSTKPSGVSPGEPRFFRFAFHSKASVSKTVTGALECPVPDSTVETSFFAITLDAEAVSTVPGDSFYLGQWDSNPAVVYSTYHPPLILSETEGQAGNYKFRMVPTLGGVAGGTRVTIRGARFDYSKYHPVSDKGIQCAQGTANAAVQCSRPRCNENPIPLCTFGMSSTTEVEFLDGSTLVCISPVLQQRITQAVIVSVEVAMDGQTFTSSGLSFQYNPPATVSKIEPTAGVVSGGTPILVHGTGFLDSGDPDVDRPQSLKVLTCVFISKADPTKIHTMPAMFLSTSRVQCDSPAVDLSETYRVDVSLSGQTSFLQLTGSMQEYLFYQDPLVFSIEEPIGSIDGGEKVVVTGQYFLDLQEAVCKFGSLLQPAVFLDVRTIECVAPRVDSPAQVSFTVSMNGYDFTSSNITYVFYELINVQPSSGPIQGGTWVELTVDTGMATHFGRLSQDQAHVYRVKFGSHQDNQKIEGSFIEGSSNGGRATLRFFLPREDDRENDLCLSTDECDPAKVSLAFTAKKQFSSFRGQDFMFYDTRYRSVLPCNSEPCKALSLPKDGKQYPVTFKADGLVDVVGPKCAFYPLKSEVDLTTWDRFFSGRVEGESDFRTSKSNLANSMPPQVIFSDAFYDPTEQAIACLAPGLDESGNKTYVGNTVTIAREDADLVYGYVATVALNGQNFDHEEFQLLYLTPPRVHAVMSEQGKPMSGGDATRSVPLKIIGSNWSVADTIPFYRQSTVVTPESLVAGEYPNTLSCIFYAPMPSANSAYRFAEAQNPVCNGDYCEATCNSPTYTDEEMDQGILYTQVFMSMNQRDPCMRCGCKKIGGGEGGRDARRGDDECLCGDPELYSACRKDFEKEHGWDFNSIVSRYDSKSLSFCNNKQLSHTLFCGDANGCHKPTAGDSTSLLRLHDCTPRLQFSNYTFYAPPVVRSVEPATIAEVNNQTITVALSGYNFNSIMWTQYPQGTWLGDAQQKYCGQDSTADPLYPPVAIKITYKSATTYVSELREARYDFCRKELLLRVPIPCAIEELRIVDPTAPVDPDPWRGCFAAFKNTNFNQSKPELRIDFEFSFNNGVQFSRAETPVLVYSQATCPSIGCGHGTCVKNDFEAGAQCVCNVWDNSNTAPLSNCSRDGRPNPTKQNTWYDFPFSQQGANPQDWVLGGSGDAAGTFLFCPTLDERPRGIYSSQEEQLCRDFEADPAGESAFRIFSGGAGALDEKQPGFLQDSVLKKGRAELSCSAGPTVEYIWPTLGSSSGGTIIAVNMSMWWYPHFSETPWQYFKKITDTSDSSIACYFRDCQTSSPAIIQDPDVKGVSAEFRCDVPAAQAGMTSLTLSMRNTKGEKSPLDFPGTFDFQYYTPPVIFNIRLMNGTTWDRSSFAHRVSAPICTFCPRPDENAAEGRVVGENCMQSVTEPSELHPIGADCPEWKIYVNGTGFIDSHPLACQYALADPPGSYPVVTAATWISSQVVECAIPTTARGEWKGQEVNLRVTLDGQVFTSQKHTVDFYPQPTVWTLTQPEYDSNFKEKTTAGFGVDWRESDPVLETLFGVDQVHRESTSIPVDKRLEKVPQYFRRAPTKGGTPLAMYIADGCSSCSQSRQIESWRDSIQLMFSPCPARPGSSSHIFLDYCSCDLQKGKVVGLTDITPDGTKTANYNDRDVYKLSFSTPAMEETDAGDYLVCFTLNGLHFVPLEEEDMLGSTVVKRLFRVGFNFYPTPTLTSLGFTSGPIQIETPYTLEVSGQNFLSDVTASPRYPHMVQVYLGGRDTGGTAFHFNFRRAPPQNVSVVGSDRLSFIVPDMMQLFTQNFKVNISISFNGYDFTQLEAGVTEFLLYGIPEVHSIFPAFGHTDFDTIITIFGKNFQNNPGRTKCKFESENPPRESELVPATFISTTQMRCTVASRLKGPNDEFPQLVERLKVKFTSDGTEITRAANPSLFKSLLVTAGELRVMEDVPSLNISATALPIEGGVMFPVVIAQRAVARVDDQCTDDCGRDKCLDFAGMAQIHPVTKRSSLQIAIVPLSGTWRILRPAEYGDVIQCSYESSPGVPATRQYVYIQGEMFHVWDCVTIIYLKSPVLPFPMLGSLKFSYNDGQKFVGPAATILFFRQTIPAGLAPARGSRSAKPRPQVTSFFQQKTLNGASPPITVFQAKNAFKKAVGCAADKFYTCSECDDAEDENCCDPSKIMICPTGPKCTFEMVTTNTTVTVGAEFDFEVFNGNEMLSISCVPPEMPVGYAMVNVSMDSLTYIQNPIRFYFFDIPQVYSVYPTAGLFDAETKLRVSGSGFLQNDPGEVQLFCIFNFRNVTPSEDRWPMPPFYTQARYIASDKIECKTPYFSQGSRPSVPRYPRAHVGVIVDGRCNPPDTCAELKNVGQNLWSDAFFQYTDRPTIQSIVPSTGLAQAGGTVITIYGSNFFRKFNFGLKSSWDPAKGDPERGYTEEKIKRLDGTWDNAIFGLTCKFGNVSSRVTEDDYDVVSCGLPKNPCTRLRCPTPDIDMVGINVLDVQVSLNAERNEYSNSLEFVFNTPQVFSLLPESGTADGGGRISIAGENFVDTPCEGDVLGTCLQCEYTAVSATARKRRVKATFVNDKLVLCDVLPSSAMGFFGPVDNCGEGCYGQIQVTVSSNGVEFTAATANTIYTYETPVYFEDFEPVAGPVAGNTSVTIFGRGFYSNLDIKCRFGSTATRAKYISFQQIECLSPPWATTPVDGGVFMGFSTNNEDYCELLPVLASEPLGPFTCNFTHTAPVRARPFYYHKPMQVLEITPPAGIDTGGTEVHLRGSGFQDYGQRLRVYFGRGDYQVDTPAEHVNETHIKFTTPRLPAHLNSENEDTSGEGKYWILDIGYPITVSSNRQQFTIEQVGQNCEAAVPPVGNPQAQCSEPFVLFTWYKNPIITGVSKQTSQWYSKLSLPLYEPISEFPDVPQGPVAGGTVVTVSGMDFTSLGRPRIDGGIGVQPQGCTGQYATSPCYTTCNFPFIHAIQGSQYYYTCINLKRTSDQAVYNPDVYWCAVGESKTFANQYGICNPNVGKWKDFNQGGKFVTNLQCKFGEIHVDATVIDNATITCTSPPVNDGIIVPLSVTMNRKDYTRILASTYFQYIRPAPQVTRALLSDSMGSITIQFNTRTNLQGLVEPDRIMKGPSQERSACEGLFSENFVATLGSGTYAECKWGPLNSSVTVKLGESANFHIGDVVEFTPRACEDPAQVKSIADECWYARQARDLLISPFILPPRACNYPTIAGGCEQFYSQSKKWCGRCVPVGEEGANGIPTIKAVDLSYPFNHSVKHLKIEPPLSAPQPTVRITGPKVVDTCLEVCFGGENDGKPCSAPTEFCGQEGVCRVQLAVLSGETSFGNYGRPFTNIKWGLDPARTEDMSLQGNLSLFDGHMTARMYSTARAKALRPGQKLTYCFTLTLTNWLGQTGTSASCYKVEQHSGLPTPGFEVETSAKTIDGGIKELLLSEDLVIAASARASSCARNNSINMDIVFEWDVDPQPVGWGGIARNSGRLNVPALAVSWDPELQYELSLTVKLMLPEGSLLPHTEATENFVFVFKRTPVVAQIIGGDRTAGTMDDLVIDASSSYSPDVVESDRDAGNDLLFCWRCRLTNHDECPDMVLGTFQIPGTPCWTCPWDPPATNTPLWTISKDNLQLSVDYQVAVQVKAMEDGVTCADITDDDPLVDLASVTIFMADDEGRPPFASILPLNLPLIAKGALDYSAPVRMAGDVYAGDCYHGDVTFERCAVEYKWTFEPVVVGYEEGLTVRGFGRVALFLPAKILEKNELSEAYDAMYTITLTAKDETGMIGSSALSVGVNLGAQCEGTKCFAVKPVDPAIDEGSAMDTAFSLTCDGWLDQHMPLQYEFRVKVYLQTCQGEDCRIETVDSTLGGRQMGKSKVTTLPPGNPENDHRLEIQAIVYDALGATQVREVIVKSVFVPNVPILIEKARTEFGNAIASGNLRAASQQLTLFGGLLGHKELAKTSMKADAAKLRETLAELVAQYYASGGRRRRNLLNSGTVPCAQCTYDECVQSLGANHALLWSSSPAVLTEALCTPALSIISNKLGQACTIGMNDQDKIVNANLILKTVANCQQHMTYESYSHARNIIDYVGVLWMKGRGANEHQEFQVARTIDFFVRYQRFPSSRGSLCVFGGSCVDYQTVSATMSTNAADVIAIQIPDSMRDPGGGSLFDIQVVLFGNEVNPFSSKSNVTLHSRMMRVNARTADTQRETLEAGDVNNYQVDELSRPVTIQMRTCATCAISKEATKNKTSGAYSSNVCGTWNNTRSTWTQFSEAFTDKSLTKVPCETQQLVSEFAIFQGVVGCDNKASDNPAINNACFECNGGDPAPRQGICDHLGVPCLLSVDMCSHLVDVGKNACPESNPDCCLDACYVCGGKNSKFTEEKYINESGLCDYTGKTCAPGTQPSICGICDIKAHQKDRQPNAGVCDCENGGTPNGGKKVDRCNECGGGNRSMDYCGHNPHIPSKYVCHTQGAEGNQAWNASCSGCDGVPRPDLPWSAVAYRWDVSPNQCDEIVSAWGRGGVQCDACGVCGGDSSTCVGCDGEPAGEGAVQRFDVCDVCGGDDSACLGCDSKVQYTPTQLDTCGTCGGPTFAACNSLALKKYYCNLEDYQPYWTDADGKHHKLMPDEPDFEENKNLCMQGCDGVIKSGAKYNKCGICGADDSVCLPPCCEVAPKPSATCCGANGGQVYGKCFGDKADDVALRSFVCSQADITCVASAPTCVCPNADKSNCWDRTVWTDKVKCEYGIWQDQCGKCGGDSTTCMGCDNMPYSGRVNDLCGQCDGDGSSCVGCDGVINSGKERDSCGVCDGGDANRDICGVCIFAPAEPGASCKGCDNKPHSGKAIDACGECGGSNLCKWRDGDPPPESGGSTDAVVMEVPLGPV